MLDSAALTIAELERAVVESIELDWIGTIGEELDCTGTTGDEVDCAGTTGEELGWAGAAGDVVWIGEAAAELDWAGAPAELDAGFTTFDELGEVTTTAPPDEETTVAPAVVVDTTTGGENCTGELEATGAALEEGNGVVEPGAEVCAPEDAGSSVVVGFAGAVLSVELATTGVVEDASLGAEVLDGALEDVSPGSVSSGSGSLSGAGHAAGAMPPNVTK